MPTHDRQAESRAAERGAQIADRLVRRGLRLPHLRIIVALEATGQISGAADLLAMSQPAVSRLCAELERIAGVKLYRRHARGVVLTPYGERLARRAWTILRALDEADREIAELKSGVRGKVWIGAVTGAAIELVLPAIKHARINFPHIDVSVDVATSDDLTAALDAGRLDFFVGRVGTASDPRLYDARLIGNEPLALIVRPGHPLTRQDPLRLDDCVHYDWVMQPEGALLRRTVEGYLRERRVALPTKVLSTSSILLTLITVTQTNAIAPIARVVADFFAASGGGGHRVETLDVARDIAIAPYSLITLAGQELSPASRILYDLIGRQSHGAES
ncbi:LysR family transcriptional regulator [Tistlia consotensis]|nr:LysR family transcriptional regulator [Tistlia consotensis]